MLHIRTLAILGATLGALAAAPAGAQQDTTHKAGGLTKVGQDVSGAVKGAGRATKKGVKHVGSQVHHGLKHAGRNLKSTAAKATGDTIPEAPGHKPGGLNKVARDVSGSVKSVGRSAKSGIHSAGSGTHKTLQAAGHDVKATVKDSIH